MADNVRAHLTDPRRHRATFGFRYPDEVQSLATRSDLDAIEKEAGNSHATVQGKKVRITAKGVTIASLEFRDCNFHTTRGKRATVIESVTFRDCIFMDCVMGFLSFRHVHIDRCRFVRCDFSRTEFVECIVDEHCEFEGCSADDCRVQCTELRPQTFLKGMPFQEQNLSVLPGDERQKQRSLWLNNTARLAGQLLRSNRDVANRAYEDEAVFLERRASLALAWRRWRCGGALGTPVTCSHALSAAPLGPIKFCLSWAWLKFTKAGTSLANQMVFGLVSTAALAVGLIEYRATYSGVSCASDPGTVAWLTTFVETYPRAAALFLGFGHTHLQVNSAAIAWLALGASGLGLAWYAAVAHVLLRRIAR